MAQHDSSNSYLLRTLSSVLSVDWWIEISARSISLFQEPPTSADRIVCLCKYVVRLWSHQGLYLQAGMVVFQKL